MGDGAEESGVMLNQGFLNYLNDRGVKFVPPGEVRGMGRTRNLARPSCSHRSEPQKNAKRIPKQEETERTEKAGINEGLAGKLVAER